MWAFIRRVCFLGIFFFLGCQQQEDLIQQALNNYVYTPSENARIHHIENHLSALIPMKDQSNWNIIDRMKHYQIPGVSFAIIQDFNIMTTQTYGYANVLGKEAITPKTLFAAGSLSKFITALAISKLEQSERIQLDTPVQQLLTSWDKIQQHATKDRITLKQLLSHTAGINIKNFEGYPSTAPLPLLTQILDGLPPANSPAIRSDSATIGRFQYSSGAYAIIQQALEDALGQEFEDMVKHQLFAPLQLTQSTFTQPVPAQFGKASNGYSAGVENNTLYPELAAKGLWSTPSDLATILIELQKSLKGNRSIFTTKTATALLAPISEDVTPGYRKYNPNFWLSDYGLGIATIRRAGRTKAQYFTHGGDRQGFKSRIIAHMDKGYGAVVMVNTDHAEEFIEELLRSIALTYHWEDYLPYHQVKQKTRVTITGYHNAAKVSIAGSFNYWKPSMLEFEKENGQWHIDLPLPEGKYMYKIVVDDLWLLDPDNPLTEIDNNTENSLLVVKP